MATTKKSAPYESAEQIALIKWLRRNGHFVFHIPNHKEMRKDQGALPGIPDLQIVLESGRVLWVEMKRRKGGRVDPAQKVVHAKLKELGHDVIIGLGAKDAREQVLRFIDDEVVL